MARSPLNDGTTLDSQSVSFDIIILFIQNIKEWMAIVMTGSTTDPKGFIHSTLTDHQNITSFVSLSCIEHNPKWAILKKESS